MRNESTSTSSPATRETDLHELKALFYKLDLEHERLKAVYSERRGEEAPALREVRLAKERVARAVFELESC